MHLHVDRLLSVTNTVFCLSNNVKQNGKQKKFFSVFFTNHDSASYPLGRMHSKGYCNRSVCLLVSLWASHYSLVSGYITQYFGQLGFERHVIGANRNGFSRVCFVIEKKREKS